MGKADQQRVRELEQIAKELRIAVLKMVYSAGSGHIGGSLSAADIVTALYFDKMRIKPEEPDWDDRDRFILSKGHAGPILYAALARRGYFPMEELSTLRKLGSRLSGHPACFKTPGVDMTSGSLGHGLSVGLGMRLAGRVKGKDYRVFVLLGDGEIQEGQVWEAAMAAAHFKVDNLVAVVDYNRVQLDGTVEEVMEVAPLADKWRSFGWQVLNMNGHNMADILPTLDEAIDRSKEGPVVVIADTVKGKGVSFMEGKSAWHGRCPTEEEYRQALAELEGQGGEVV
ncbi:MAG TPA: transketolase [Firmicutes bacterium]|nr:transketolase [Bacillota bacterium]